MNIKCYVVQMSAREGFINDDAQNELMGFSEQVDSWQG